MTRYEKYSQIDTLAKIIYDNDVDEEDICTNSPFRVNGDCPVDEDDICEETCLKCIKAWLMMEDKDE